MLGDVPSHPRLLLPLGVGSLSRVSARTIERQLFPDTRVTAFRLAA